MPPTEIPANVRIVAIPMEVGESVRSTQLSPVYGHPAHAELAQGHGPCRQCLRSFNVGQERRVLFTYDSFTGIDVPPRPGPVFIHEDPCLTYPAAGPFPEDIRLRHLRFNAFGSDRTLWKVTEVGDGNVGPTIREMFSDPKIQFIQVEDVEAGCYDFHLVRMM